MAAKRKAPLPPPRSPSSSSSSDSSSDSSSGEEPDLATPTPPVAKNLKSTDQPSNKSDPESESDSDPEPPKATPKAPLKPSNSDSSSSSADESDEESKPKSQVKKSESKPDKKKEKVVSGPAQSPSVKLSSSAFLRIWSEEDEMAILKALSEYHARKGLLPQVKEYAAFLSTVSSSIGFPVTEKQLGNKIQQFKRAYDKKIKRGTDVNLLKPHDKARFEICAKLFEGRSSKAASEKKVKLEPKNAVNMENGAASNGHAMGRAANGGMADGDAMGRSYYYLREFTEELIKEQRPGGLSTVEDFIAQIGEPKAKALEAKSKTLRIDMFKLLARKEALRAELFDIIADEMADD